ncbi:MAG TPA: heme A synthase [Actinobacteria bacterium]|nr:heme A synthase [Actinomycetota bacterium]
MEIAGREALRRRYGTVAWLVLGLLVVVVLGGAVVRATGSGDGCGASWPTCEGALVPTRGGETRVEFAHRLMTGAVGIGVAALVVGAHLGWPAGHRVRRAAVATGLLLVVESLLGAALVLFGWVDADVSVGRLVVVPLHLVNTYLLLGAAALTAWWGSGRPGPVRRVPRRLVAGGVALVVVGALGALNALADTVVPVAEAAEAVGNARLLADLRVAHPLVAIVLGLFVASILAGVAGSHGGVVGRLGAVVGVLLVLQVFVGMANVLLGVPLGLQVLHLAIADVMWIAYVLVAAAAVGARVEEPVA